MARVVEKTARGPGNWFGPAVAFWAGVLVLTVVVVALLRAAARMGPGGGGR